MIPRRVSLALVLLALPALAAAQSKSDAFAGKIPPVSGQLFRVSDRVELTLGAAISLNDAFFTKYFGSVKATYHLGEFWTLGAYGAGGAADPTNSAVLCSSSVGCGNAQQKQLWQVPGSITAIVGLEAGWTPVYGKLNVLAEQVAHFDLSILAGPDLVLHDEVLSFADAERLATAGGSPGQKMAFGGHVGVGARLFLSEWGAIRLEVKDLFYPVEVPNNAALGTDWQNQLFTEIGFSFFFPTRNRPVR
ncbi:MAG TPA: outer membrane beta-barrel domain-containing protein [Anaeromyxobacter sp.]|nr:outer membrane beta-barrel domain-containing protein [Anaeromyxobacter sp.]